MNNINIVELHNIIEEESKYLQNLKERFIDQVKFRKVTDHIYKGIKILGYPEDVAKIFLNLNPFFIWLGSPITQYKDYEWALYIGHKKAGLPIPTGLKEKCPECIISLIDISKPYKLIYEFNTELKNYSLSCDIFLSIHKSYINARLESLLPNLLSDIERMVFKAFSEALEKIPKFYLEYLSEPSLAKLFKKISAMLQQDKERVTEELRSINLYEERIKEQISNLYMETNAGLKDILDNLVSKGSEFEIITQKTSNLFSRLIRLFLGNVHHLRDYERRRMELQKFLKEEEDAQAMLEKRTLDRKKPINELFEEYIFCQNYGTLTPQEEKIFARNVIFHFEELHRQKHKDVPLLAHFEKKGLLGVELDFNEVKNAYETFMRKELLPVYLGNCLFEIVDFLPPSKSESKKMIKDIANFKYYILEGKEILTPRSRNDVLPEEIKNFLEQYRRTITVLIYDIRGSSYMGVKLHNALKEQRIKYKFAKEMATIGKNYGGFLLKDTGDGGILWFAENSESLYNHLYAESTTGKGINLRYSIFSGAELELIPSTDASKRAILCARDMVIKAEEFIRANFIHYRDWFASVAERTMEIEGVTYALLPPEFKSLFRIGIGIASGSPERDVVLSANSFGDPDLVGPILADAHLYSMERMPGRSVIICDLPSFINFMLNAENFEFPIEESEFDKYLRILEDVRKLPHGYLYPEYKISIAPRGMHILEELDKRKALCEMKSGNLMIDEAGNLYNEEKKKAKIFYEIIPL
uniref:Uncharacterized protein n=1 Tax=candidate division WOR-3 bacterium TaxID=2052148 RepID=A0A7V3VTN3_UNCW3